MRRACGGSEPPAAHDGAAGCLVCAAALDRDRRARAPCAACKVQSRLGALFSQKGASSQQKGDSGQQRCGCGLPVSGGGRLVLGSRSSRSSERAVAAAAPALGSARSAAPQTTPDRFQLLPRSVTELRRRSQQQAGTFFGMMRRGRHAAPRATSEDGTMTTGVRGTGYRRRSGRQCSAAASRSPVPSFAANLLAPAHPQGYSDRGESDREDGPTPVEDSVSGGGSAEATDGACCALRERARARARAWRPLLLPFAAPGARSSAPRAHAAPAGPPPRRASGCAPSGRARCPRLR